MDIQDIPQQAEIDVSPAVKTSEVLTETNVKLIGDRATLCQIVQLLAYVRNILRNGDKRTLAVDMCGKVSGGRFMFDVNGMEIPDLIAPDRTEID